MDKLTDDIMKRMVRMFFRNGKPRSTRMLRGIECAQFANLLDQYLVLTRRPSQRQRRASWLSIQLFQEATRTAPNELYGCDLVAVVTDLLLRPVRRDTRSLTRTIGWVSQQLHQALRFGIPGTLRGSPSQVATFIGTSMIQSRRLLGRNAANAVRSWIRKLRANKLLTASILGSTPSLTGTGVLAARRQYSNDSCQVNPPLPLGCCEDKDNFPEECCVGPEPLPAVCRPEFQPPPNCQSGDDNVFCQALDEDEWDGTARRKRAIILPLSLSPAREGFDTSAGHQQFGIGSLDPYLPTELNEGDHSVHKHAIVTLTTIFASIILSIQLFFTTAGTALAAAAPTTGAALSSAATTAGTAVAAGAATAINAGTAFAATGIGHAALTVASGAASTAAMLGGEALDLKAKIESFSHSSVKRESSILSLENFS